VVFLCISQVDVFGLADPYVCLSAIAVPDCEKVLHDAKITAAQVSKSGQWLVKPQGMTKTVKSDLNPIFEEQFVLYTTVATQNTLAEEIRGQEVCLLVSVHDWNRTSSDVFMGACRIKMAAKDNSNAGHSNTENQVHVIQNEAGASLTDTSGKVSTVVLSVSYEASKIESSSAPVTSNEIAQNQHTDAKAASEAKAAAVAKAKAEAEGKAEQAKKKTEAEEAATKKLADQKAAARKRAEGERKRAEDAASAVAAPAERKEAQEASVQ
jgi:hypothetical protein